MKRLMFAFILAFLIHMAILFIPFVQMSYPPRTISDKAITITLSRSLNSTENTTDIRKNFIEEQSFQEQAQKDKVVVKNKKNVEKRELVKPLPDIKSHRRADPVHPAPEQQKVTTSTTRKSRHSEATPVKISVVEATPLYQHNPKPRYPLLARKRKWQGTVMIKVLVSSEGMVQDISLNQSSGHTILDKSALRTVKQWRFLPGTINGKKHSMTVLVPVHFVLQ